MIRLRLKFNRIFLLLTTLAFNMLLVCNAGNATSANCLLLKSKCQELTQNSDHRKVLEESALLLKEAEKANSNYFRAYAYYYEGLSNIILGNSQPGKQQLDKAQSIAGKLSNDTLQMSILNGYGIYEANTHTNYALAQYYFFKSLEYAVKIKDQFRQALIECNLAEIAYIRKDTTGIKYALHCYQWGKDNNNKQILFAGAYHCANLYHLAGNNDNALKYLETAHDVAIEEQYSELSTIYKLYGSIAYSQRKYGEATMWLEKAIANTGKAQAATLPEIYLLYAKVLAQQGRLDASNGMIRRAVGLSDSLHVNSSLPELYELRSSNYEKSGNYRAALISYKKYKQYCDSIYSIEQQHSINELRIQYDIDKRERDAAFDRLQLQSEKRKNIILVTSLLFAVAVILIVFFYYRRQKKLYKKIVAQNIDALAREQELKKRISDTDTKADLSKPQTKLNGEKAQEIFDELCRIMEYERAFADQSTTRDSLAEKLGTNRTYLSKIISDKTGGGYYQFVNSYRIKEAVRILSNPEYADYPLKALCQDLGFSSMATFYKAFQNIVGMTPSAYKNTMRDM